MTSEWLRRVRERNQPKRRRKFSYLGPPACFLLEQACQHINQALGGFGCYQVGSSLERPDFRDIDIRFIMEDSEFAVLFPDVDVTSQACLWERDPRWLLMNVSISMWLQQQTGLPRVDFQIWPQTHANRRHGGKPRNPVGLRFRSPRAKDE
jgi:hypothetical protein